MTSKTKGIVLRTMKYSDKASIVTIYTRDYGRMSYMAYGMYGKKSAAKAANFLPLSLIEITAPHHPNREIQTIKEVRTSESLPNIHQNPIKSSIALFVAELLYKTLKHPEPEIDLFDFVQDAILKLNNLDAGIANFHLVFSMQLCQFLGIQPNGDMENPVYFDMLNGVFSPHHPQHEHVLTPAESILFLKLIQLDFDDMDSLKLSRENRNNLLDKILEYYKLHIAEFYGLNSKAVLHEIFS